MFLELTRFPSSFCYQLTTARRLSTEDPTALAADGPLQKRFKNSTDDQVAWLCEEACAARAEGGQRCESPTEQTYVVRDSKCAWVWYCCGETVIQKRSCTLQQSLMLLELTSMSLLSYTCASSQLKTALALSKNDPAALAAQPKLKMKFESSHGEQVPCWQLPMRSCVLSYAVRDSKCAWVWYCCGETVIQERSVLCSNHSCSWS